MEWQNPPLFVTMNYLYFGLLLAFLCGIIVFSVSLYFRWSGDASGVPPLDDLSGLTYYTRHVNSTRNEHDSGNSAESDSDTINLHESSKEIIEMDTYADRGLEGTSHDIENFSVDEKGITSPVKSVESMKDADRPGDIKEAVGTNSQDHKEEGREEEAAVADSVLQGVVDVGGKVSSVEEPLKNFAESRVHGVMIAGTIIYLIIILGLYIEFD
tara:strand:- start:1076 stop:1714 length:639 start_codon:yes stop_codon:yes gene_type:complete